MKSEKFITEKEKKKKAKIKAISSEDRVLSNKRKRIEEALFNASASGEDNYLNANYTFLKELQNISFDDFNILDASEEQVIDLMITINPKNPFDDFNILIAFDKKLVTLMTITDVIELSSHVVVDSDCFRHSFANRSIFITYEIIHSRLIKGIKDSQVQSIGRGTVILCCEVAGKRVTVNLPNVLHMSDMGVNLLSVDKLLDADIVVTFHKAGYTLAINNNLIVPTLAIEISSF